MQVGLDHPSATSGLDILNLATAGANSFEGNDCLTSVNAPCPSPGPSLTANPNPIPVTDKAALGQTTISWSAPDAQVIEIHIGSPNGKLFTMEGNRGSIQTGLWVSDSLTFYLQDVTNGNPLTSDYTLATLAVHLQTTNSTSGNGATFPHFGGGARWWTGGFAAVLLALSVVWIRRGSRRSRTTLGGAALLAAEEAGVCTSAAALDKCLDAMPCPSLKDLALPILLN